MSKETYYGKILWKHIERFMQKHKKVTDLQTMKELEQLFTISLVECINDLHERLRKLEKERSGKKV